MNRQVFRAVLAVAITVLFGSLIAYSAFLYSAFVRVEETHLNDQLSIARVAVEHEGEQYLRDVDSDSFRLTWIDAEGTVLYDTEKSASQMSNHADREEFREALSSGHGSSERYSSTLAEKTVYEAVRLEDGSVLRMSLSRQTILAMVWGMLEPTVVIGALAALLCVLLARRVSRNFVRPINALDLDNPLDNDVYPELSPLLNRMDEQRQTIKAHVEELRRRSEEFEQITANMREGLVLLDRERKIVSMNAAAAKIFGASADPVGLDFLVVERDPEVNRAIEKAFAVGDAEIRQERAGRQYVFDISKIASEGGAVGVVILAIDRSDKANAERARREFTANVSHELKTPLQSILGSVELIENGMVSPEDSPRFLGKIHTEAERMIMLVDDILRLSRLDEGGNLPKEIVDVAEVARGVCESLESRAAKKSVRTEVSGAGKVHGVRSLLHEIIYNLVNNSITYGREGGSVAVSVANAGNNVRITVTDDGVGIAPEEHSRIFERFYRVDKSRSKESGGTGLGLSIVKHAVEYHRGSVRLESTPGEGTTVTVEIPRFE